MSESIIREKAKEFAKKHSIPYKGNQDK